MNKVLAKIKLYTIGSKGIVAFDARWLDVINSDNPTFDFTIENNRIILVGPKLVRKNPTLNPRD